MQGYFALCRFCNQKCRTCPTDITNKKGDWIDFDLLKGNIALAMKRGMNEICLSGGEPLAYPHFNDLIDYLAKVKLKVTILTNATLMEDKYIKHLLKIKDHVRIVTAIHHFEADKHDDITQTPGSFDKAMNGLRILNGLGFMISVKIILNKTNYLSLKEMYCFLLNNFKNYFAIDVCGMDYSGEARNNMDLFINGQDIKKSLEDLAIFHVSKLDKKPRLSFSEFPICFMDKHSIMLLVQKQSRNNFAYESTENGIVFNSPYSCGPFSTKCRSCLFEKTCPGIWANNLKEQEEDLVPLGVSTNEQ